MKLTKQLTCFLFMLPFLFSNLSEYSQIKVYEDNRVKFFGDKPTDDPYQELSLQVYGKYGSYLENGRIGIGNYNEGGLLTTKQVYIGEAGINSDSDRLELCGSNGIYFTWGRGYSYNNVIAKIDLEFDIIYDVITNVSKFKFNTDVYSTGILINSDERFKENIAPIVENDLRLFELTPVSYNLKPGTAFEFPGDIVPETDKEKRDMLEMIAAAEKIKILEKERFGFIAGEIQEVFPELVGQGEDGLYVDYLGLLPILVETIKIQQLQITELTNFLNTQIK